jgi:hypothetical protein
MPIEVTCNCGKKFRIKDEFTGRKFRCPDCGVVNRAEAPPPPTDWFSQELSNQPAPAPSLPAVPPETAPTPPEDAGPSPQPEKKNSLLVRCALMAVGIALLGGSPFAAYSAYNNYIKGKASVNWPSVEGTITRSSVETSTGRRGRTNYNAKIEYRYAVNGHPFSGSRVRFTDMSGSSESSAQALVDSYPVNSKHNVFYDPDDPSCCTLEPGINLVGAVMRAVIPIGLIAGGIYLIVLSRKQ